MPKIKKELTYVISDESDKLLIHQDEYGDLRISYQEQNDVIGSSAHIPNDFIHTLITVLEQITE